MEAVAETAQPRNGAGTKRKRAALAVFGAMALVAIVTIFFYMEYKKTHITTDDAFVDGHMHMIAPKVPGTVKNVAVNANQFVKKGDLLVELDTADYDVKVQRAEGARAGEAGKVVDYHSRIDVARMQLTELRARAESARANLDLQKANLRQAESDIRRAERLFQSQAISKERFEKTRTGYDVAAAQVKVAEEQLTQALSTVETQKSAVKQAEAMTAAQAAAVTEKAALLDAARLEKSYTRIYAPVDGYVTKKSVEVGNQLQAGQPIMAIVPLDDIHVVANYKETQLERVRPGQKVEIRVDTFPGRTFQGTVESIMAGTGSVFSLFPPENATGNYVKVVQRVPVKIVFDRDTDKEHVLRVGMSAEPTILVR